jgi:hypothetical protein
MEYSHMRPVNHIRFVTGQTVTAFSLIPLSLCGELPGQLFNVVIYGCRTPEHRAAGFALPRLRLPSCPG